MALARQGLLLIHIVKVALALAIQLHFETRIDVIDDQLDRLITWPE